MEVTKELIAENIGKMQGQIGNQLFESGRQVGKLEGARDMLQQILALMNAEPKVSVEEAALKIADDTKPDTGAEAGEGQ